MKTGNVTIILIAINILMFLAQALIPNFTESLLLTPDIITRPWILITSMFLHGSLFHIFGNMFALGLFGLILEHELGAKRFAILYFATGIISGIASAQFYNSALGASGAISGALGTLAMLRPRMTVWTYGVPMPMIVAAVFWLFLDIMGTFYPSNVANIAHIVGLAAGVAVGLVLRQNMPKEHKEQRRDRISNEEFNKWEDEWV